MVTAARHVDVAVIGAGAAGLAAAVAAAEAGTSVTVIDGGEQPGGQYFRQPASPAIHPSPTQQRGRELAEHARRAGVDILSASTVWGARPGHLDIVTNGELATITCTAMVIASGAYERAAAFPGWTLPGVYTAGALQTLLKEHRVVPGERVVLAGTGPLQLVVAAALARHGSRVAGLYEGSRLGRQITRSPLRTTRAMWGHGGRIGEAAGSIATLLRRRVDVRTGWGVVEAVGTTQVDAAIVARLDHEWNPIPGSHRRVECDTIAIHYGLVPSIELLQLLGVAIRHEPGLGGWVPRVDHTMSTSVTGVYAAGDCTGIGGVDMSLVEGEIAGRTAASFVHGQEHDVPAPLRRRLRRELRFQALYACLFTPGAGIHDLADDDTIMCRCENVTSRTVDDALDRGATSAANLKSVTRAGMGPCQGRVCAPIIAGRLTCALGEAPQPFTARPPLTPIRLGALYAEAHR